MLKLLDGLLKELLYEDDDVFKDDGSMIEIEAVKELLNAVGPVVIGSKVRVGVAIEARQVMLLDST